ncbi:MULTISPECIES: D-amino acid dehydrogenase [Acinetobacter]|uniref:D-amino acid dehydrogenase n=1 Tax=Acinetobacter seifertii TaxID=1530123 RepID=A0A2T5QWE6_9GAMM|nr:MULTISPECIES: D-amino acid dehydrogenase [Acinetobacter]MBJ8505110.1 D-amino acid dehydrogenase [Acinetobacter seifertii]MBZ6533632.1 D-amino acid dehydrogenase [Acinetobacter seifertii]MCH2001272.1 D-amino acid dehydrogenase [Acinetobacter seifertii]MDQ9035965.1 D-amino acid dehydrogenase [Acinetobacter seifertii]ONN50158.1 amino acid dehydrogenase [Acinetobacter genomosp. 33YU]
MPHVIVIGAGITGVTSAYELSQLGYQVTVIDRHLYPAMETSFANGGQLSACNAEVWNQKATVIKGFKWMRQKDAPLLLNPSFSLHKYSWLVEFLSHIKNYEANTIETVRLALLARKRLFEVAEKEQLQFDLEKRGILHMYHSKADYDVAKQVNDVLNKGTLERYSVSPEEMKTIEPSLTGDYFGGYYTPSDATGDIHKYSTALAEKTKQYGVQYKFGLEVTDIKCHTDKVVLNCQPSAEHPHLSQSDSFQLEGDVLVVCGGVGSYQLADMVGERVNVYPVKGYSITVQLKDEKSIKNAPWVSLLDESAKIVTSRLGQDRLRIAGTAEFNGYNRDIRADRIQPLVNWVNRNFDISTEHVVPWAGLRPMMPNMLPVVKQSKQPRVFYNTGHGHLGWTLSAATAVLVSQDILQKYPA